MIIIKNFDDRTNSYYTTGWDITKDPFPAYRAYGTAHTGFQPFCAGFDPEKPSKLITTQKGTKLLVNCPQEEDETIYLLHFTGGFRGWSVGALAIKNAEVISERSSSKHCNPTASIVLKVNDSKDWYFVYLLDSSRRGPRYYIMGSFLDEIKVISEKEEYEAFIDINNIEEQKLNLSYIIGII